jgi:peptide deformylase
MIENGMIKINTVAQTIRPYEIYNLTTYNDPILKQICKPFDFNDPPENPVHLASSMFETMFENKGLGLSAPQIGKAYRVFVIGYDNSNKQVFFNPEIIYTSEEEEDHVEGCLSFPRLFFKVSRPKQIKIRYQHVSGEWKESEYHGLTARCILHENDHLNGICFTERVGKTTLMMAREKERKLRIKMTRGDKNK